GNAVGAPEGMDSDANDCDVYHVRSPLAFGDRLEEIRHNLAAGVVFDIFLDDQLHLHTDAQLRRVFAFEAAFDAHLIRQLHVTDAERAKTLGRFGADVRRLVRQESLNRPRPQRAAAFELDRLDVLTRARGTALLRRKRHD